LVLEATRARVNSDNTTAIIISLNAGIDPALDRNQNIKDLPDPVNDDSGFSSD